MSSKNKAELLDKGYPLHPLHTQNPPTKSEQCRLVNAGKIPMGRESDLLIGGDECGDFNAGEDCEFYDRDNDH